MAKDIPRIIDLEQAKVLPYSKIVAYPSADPHSLDSRVGQMKQLGLSHLEFDGPLGIDGLSILGKGVAGIVLIGKLNGDTVAVKIRREDSRRADLAREAQMLKAANIAGVGPRFIGYTEDVLAMEFVDGRTLPRWISGLKGRGRKARLKTVIRTLLEQCYRLDERGLDHGELSRAHKNVVVSEVDHPTILDFESSSMNRRPANVTCLAQYMFLGGIFSKKVSRILGPVNRSQLLGSLRGYKAEPSWKHFHAILAELGLSMETRH